MVVREGYRLVVEEGTSEIDAEPVFVCSTRSFDLGCPVYAAASQRRQAVCQAVRRAEESCVAYARLLLLSAIGTGCSSV